METKTDAEFTAKEETSAKVKGVLKDEEGTPVGTSGISSLGVTLYDKITGSIINGRDHVNILNTNGGSLDSDGNFSWLMSPHDNAILNDSLNAERHIALIEFTYGSGKQGKTVIGIAVLNLEKVPYTPPTPGTDTSVVAARTFYVSDSYAGISSPFFSTIQSAINAAPNDGSRTLILVGSGVYPENLSITKRGIIICGCSAREDVVIAGSSNTAPIVSWAVNNLTDLVEFGLQNLSVKNTAAGYNGMKIDITTGSNTFWLRMRSVTIDVDYIAFDFLNNTSIPTHDALLENCDLRGRSSNYGNSMRLTNPKTGLVFRRCLIKGGSTMAPLAIVGTIGTTQTIEFDACTMEAPLSVSGPIIYSVRFNRCHFGASYAIDQEDDQAVHNFYLLNCTAKATSRLIQNGLGDHQYFVLNLTGETSTGSGSIFYLVAGNPKCYLHQAAFYGRIATVGGGDPKVMVINSTVRSPSTNVLEGTSAYSVLAINLVTNGSYNAGFVTLRPQSAGNIFGNTDLFIGW